MPKRTESRHHTRLLVTAILSLIACCLMLAQTAPAPAPSQHDPHLTDYQAIEFRRYTIKPDERAHFAQYFDTYFPEAFQQLGALAAGSFLERKKPNGFTWIRAFHTLDDRAVANAAFYYGSVWNEHRNTLNDLINDSDNVMLLRPMTPERGLQILPAVDPVREPGGASGIVVAQIFCVKKDGLESFARAAEPIFARYRASGAREAGVLVTIDVQNNFPQLPIRTDGPFLVWLGILRDNTMLENQFIPVTNDSAAAFSSTGLLREPPPELVILDPTPRSRMRWLPSWH